METFSVLLKNFYTAEVNISMPREKQLKFNGYTTTKDFYLSLLQTEVTFFEELFDLQSSVTYIGRKIYYARILKNVKGVFFLIEPETWNHWFLKVNNKYNISTELLGKEIQAKIYEYIQILHSALCRICNFLEEKPGPKETLFLWKSSQNNLLEYCDAPYKSQYIQPINKNVPMLLWYKYVFDFFNKELPAHFYSYLYKINQRNLPAAFMQELTKNYTHILTVKK